MIRVLNVLSSLDGGGVEMMLFNYYSQMDHSKIQFDFVVHNPKVGMLEEPLIKMGSNIYHVTPKHASVIKNIREIDRIVKAGNYNIVQCHQNFSSFSTLIIARLRNIKIRIAHSHGNNYPKKLRIKIRNHLFRYLNSIGANYYFACGDSAGRWLFGNKWMTDEHSKIINNAIDTKKFTYDENKRKSMRKLYNIKNETILLHVGRFSAEKNHIFLIDLIELLQKQKPDRFKLYLVGNGLIKEEIEDIVMSKDLTNSVKFLGDRKDIADLLNMADYFLLPSLHEGFPVTLIEAQSSGIKVVASDTITKETKLSDRILYLPLDNIESWAQELSNSDIRSGGNQLPFEKFDIRKESINYQLMLKELVS